MKSIIYILLWIVMFSIFNSCKKDDNSQNNTNLPKNELLFTSLTAEKTILHPGQSTKITAVASGDEITYTWFVTAGDILGSGNEITYMPGPCSVGNNEVICTVKDKYKNQLSKSVIITVSL